MEIKYGFGFTKEAMRLATEAAGVGLRLEFHGGGMVYPWVFYGKNTIRLKSFETAEEAQAFIIGVSEGAKR